MKVGFEVVPQVLFHKCATASERTAALSFTHEKRKEEERDKISGLLDPPLQNSSDRKAFLGMNYLCDV